TLPDFLARTHDVLRPHVEALRRNRQLRDIQYQEHLNWETGRPPVPCGVGMLLSPGSDIRDALRAMVPHIRRVLLEIPRRNGYGDFRIVVEFIHMIRRWGADPDPEGWMMRTTAMDAKGPGISDEDVILWRHGAGFSHLDLSGLQLRDDSLAVIPDD